MNLVHRRLLFGFVLTLSYASLTGCGGKDEPTQPIPNSAPVLSLQADTTGAPGDTLRLRAHAEDPDGDVVSYSLAVIVTWVEIRSGYRASAGVDSATGAFWFRPGSWDVPRRSFLFIADDGRGGRDSTGFVVSTR